MKYFPIFQESARKLADFSYEIGLEHGRKASNAALEKGVPSTVIYFAVDMDILDYQIDSHIIPYFKGINQSIDYKYQVGIYESRNVCSRLADAKLSVSSFVSDMSTGFSGNLGFRIPSNWNYDQIYEISGYGGKWDLDKVAYSGRIPALSVVDSFHKDSNYYRPKSPNTSTLNNSISDAISLIEELEEIYDAYRENALKNINDHTDLTSQDILDIQSTHLGVLNYLSKDYLESYKFSTTAAQNLNKKFVNYIIKEHKNLYDKLEKLVGSSREDIKDTIDGKNDLAHLSYTTLCYLTNSIIPDYLSGWGGDLATGAKNIYEYSNAYPNIDKEKLAYSIIGADKSMPSDYLIDMNVELEKVECNFTDLCDDADAIGISELIKNKKFSKNMLTDSLKEYYNNLNISKRYNQYSRDGLDLRTPELIYKSVKEKFSGFMEKIMFDVFNTLVGDASDEDKDLAYKAFGDYIYRKLRDPNFS